MKPARSILLGTALFLEWAHLALAQNTIRVPELTIEIVPVNSQCAVVRTKPAENLGKLKKEVEKLSCKPEIGIFSGDFSRIDAAVKKSYAKGETLTECYNTLTDLTCSMSPWAEDNLEQRAQKLLVIAKTVKTPYADHGLNSERLLPCLAMRESALEPASTFERNCEGLDINSRGLFHIELPTLEDLTGPYFGFESQYYPRSQRPTEQYAKFLHDQLDTDIALQIELFHATLKRKKAIYDYQHEKRTGKKPKTEASLRTVLEMYNSSTLKEEYAEAVIQCMSCLKLKKNTVEACLTRAHVSGPLSLYKWKRCKTTDEPLALGEKGASK